MGIIANTVAIPEEIAEQAGLEQESGVMIFSVEAGSPARKAGLAMGDVLVKFNDKPVTDFYDLPRLLAEDVIGQRNKANHHQTRKPNRNHHSSNRSRRRRRLINQIPLEIEPPSPMPCTATSALTPPMPQLSNANAVASIAPFPSVFD